MGFSRVCGLLAVVVALLPSQLFAQYFPRGPVPMCMGPGGMRPCGIIPLPGFRPPPPMFRPGPPVIYPPPLSYYPPPPPIVRPWPPALPPNVILPGPVPVTPSATPPWRPMDSTPVAVASGRLGGAQKLRCTDRARKYGKCASLRALHPGSARPGSTEHGDCELRPG
jgi:hypothetical protein